MKPHEFEILVRSAIKDAAAARKKPFRVVTVLQYCSQLRNFHRANGGRHPRGVADEDVVRYVREVTSAWARRRAVSALSILYGYLGRQSILDDLAACGFSRPTRAANATIAKQLLERREWTVAKLAALRWSHVLEDVLPRNRPRRFTGSARTMLRALLCRRYPSAKTLLGDGPHATLVFQADELQAAVNATRSRVRPNLGRQ